MVVLFRGSFWNCAGDERSHFLCEMWRIYSDNRDVDADLARELLLIPLTFRPLFDETLDRINREMSIATSGEEFIDSGSLISAVADFSSALVQNTPLGDPEQDTTNDNAVAAPSPADDKRAEIVPPVHGQDAENATLGRGPGVANLAATVVPASQPACPDAATSPNHSAVAAASPVTLAVPPVRVTRSHWDCCRIS